MCEISGRREPANPNNKPRTGPAAGMWANFGAICSIWWDKKDKTCGPAAPKPLLKGEDRFILKFPLPNFFFNLFDKSSIFDIVGANRIFIALSAVEHLAYTL